MAAPDRSLIRDYQSPGRPLGYFLWGVLFLVIGGMLAAVPALIFYTRFSGIGSFQSPSVGELAIGWLITVPVATWLFIIIPFGLLSQAGVAFVAAGLALLPKYESTRIVEFVGFASSRFMEARVDNRALRVLSAADAVGLVPGWQFALSAMVLTTGALFVLTAPTAGGAIAGAMLALAGAGGSLVGIRNRVRRELKKSAR